MSWSRALLSTQFTSKYVQDTPHTSSETGKPEVEMSLLQSGNCIVAFVVEMPMLTLTLDPASIMAMFSRDCHVT